jgi:hypothetical protein
MKKQNPEDDPGFKLFTSPYGKQHILTCPQGTVVYKMAEHDDPIALLKHHLHPADSLAGTEQKIREILASNPSVDLKHHRPIQDALGITVISYDRTVLEQPQAPNGDVPLAPNLILPGHLRTQSLYIGGNPGYGKSSLIQNLALYDIRAGRGVCVIDPTGDLVNLLIHHIPQTRVNDTIYFDTDAAIPIDFFSYEDEPEREVLVDELVAIFSLENAPRAKPLLRKVIGTLLDANQHPTIPDKERATFLDILHFIRDKERRDDLLSYCPERRKDWDPWPKESEFEAITYRMIPFTESKTLRTILGAPQPKLNVWEVLQQNNVLLVNLKDTETDLFVGSLIAAKIQQAIFRRRIIPESERTPYYLYIDECQTILKYSEETFDKILTRARKYKLCLAMANQIPQKLPPGIQDSLGTITNLVLFNMDTQNARIFTDRMVPYQIEDLVNLEKFCAVARVGNVVRLIQTPQPLGPSAASSAETIRKRTLENYACDTPAERSKETADGKPDKPDKSETILPGPEPHVPPYQREKKNP